MARVDYAEYIQSQEWKDKSKEFVEKAGECKICGTTKRLSSHHNNYSCLGEETFADIDILCWNCHTTKAHVYAPNKTKLPLPFKEQMKQASKDAQWRGTIPSLPKKFRKRLDYKEPEKQKTKTRRLIIPCETHLYDSKDKKFKKRTKKSWFKKIDSVISNILKKMK